jgi:hypothetical protein
MGLSIVLAALCGALGFVAGFVLGRLSAGGGSTVHQVPPVVPPAATLDDAAVAAQLAVLIAAGQKIEAIKLYRERTGVGLKEAKDAVEALERDA